MSDRVLRVQAQLTDRDLLLLGWLADHGLLTSFQIAHALFPSLDFAQKRLRKLYALDLLGRFRPQKPDGGAYPYYYVLGQLGVDVVAGQRDEPMPRRNQARLRRWHLTNRSNLPHLLTVNQFFIDLAGYARTHPDAALERWWPESRCQETGAFAEDGDGFEAEIYKPWVHPDGHGIWREHGKRVPFFAEIDMGTEPLWRLTEKLKGYAELSAKIRQVWPVLFWLHSPVRERNLQQRFTEENITWPVATAVRGQDPDKSVAEDVWWLHRHDGALLRFSDLSRAVTDRRRRPGVPASPPTRTA